jgi:Holliday junction resolvasome RuvABC endonuclease subunit
MYFQTNSTLSINQKHVKITTEIQMNHKMMNLKIMSIEKCFMNVKILRSLNILLLKLRHP